MPICPQVSDLIDTDRVTNSRPFTLADGDARVSTLCSQFYSDWWSFGAPGEIRTPDPQIRGLVAPAVLALRLIVPNVGPAAASIVDEIFEMIVAALVL